MDEIRCPRCGEVDDLRRAARRDDASDVDEEIAVECGACGHLFPRPAPRCRGCGGAETVEASQQMTRHPRGTLLAVTGTRRVRLCPRCDAEVVDAARGRPVPESYLPRFAHGFPAPSEAPRPTARRRPKGPGARTSHQVLPPARPAQARPEPNTPGADPTVRRAIETFLAIGSDADPLAAVLLGQHLGAATRLSALDSASAASDLAAWYDATWAAQPDSQRQAVAHTLRALADHWRREGWLAQDLAAGLR